MLELRILDLNVPVSEDISINVHPSDKMRVFYAVDGPNIHAVQTGLETEARVHGYRVTHAENITLLERGERQIKVQRLQATRLGIVVDDAGALPHSRVLPGNVGLAGLILPIPNGARVESGRERHDPNSTEWNAEWRLYDCDAHSTAVLMHDALVKLGLRSNGIWPPPKGGIPRWKVEAYTAQVLVQTHLTENANYLLLEVALIGDL